MKADKLALVVCATFIVVSGVTSPVRTQPSDQASPDALAKLPTRNQAVPDAPLPKVDPGTSRDWPLTRLDLANNGYSTLNQITVSNVQSLALKWVHQFRNVGRSSTPIVIDGVMYVTVPQSVTALDAMTGRRIWINDTAGAGKGSVYGDGKIYVAKDQRLFALDAKTGKLVEGFGDKGISHALTDAVRARYPNIEKPGEWGYSYQIVPQYYKGIVILGSALGDLWVPGQLVLAVDGKTGKLLWSFNMVPQGPQDSGWELAKDTWAGGVRHGGGIWSTPAVDPETETLHITVGNPAPLQDGSHRKGLNLFTNCFVTLDIRTGKVKWYFQQVHHDIWDYDAAQQPNLFDMRVGGRTVKATAAGNKNGWVYILNRDTGQPINPIKEMPFPTASELPGEEPWPTQPVPLTTKGKVMTPTASQIADRELFPGFESFPKVPLYTPPTLKGAIHAPREAIHYGGNSFSPQTGLLYVGGKDVPIFLTGILVDITKLKPGQGASGGRRISAAPETGSVSAYDPATNELVWRTPIGGGVSSGTASTAGNLVFVGDNYGTFMALDAKTGKPLWQVETGGLIHGGQITYQVNGVQYIGLASGNDVMAFALPPR